MEQYFSNCSNLSTNEFYIDPSAWNAVLGKDDKFHREKPLFPLLLVCMSVVQVYTMPLPVSYRIPMKD